MCVCLHVLYVHACVRVCLCECACAFLCVCVCAFRCVYAYTCTRVQARSSDPTHSVTWVPMKLVMASPAKGVFNREATTLFSMSMCNRVKM